MTKDDKILLLRFITRTGMFIGTQDKSNIVSFIGGYELGSPTCDFSNPFKQFVEDKFNIPSGATGWEGQIERLSEKRSQTWLRTFKQVSLQFITDSDFKDLEEELSKTVKTRIQSLIERIDEQGNPWFNDWWVEEWQSLCLLHLDCFKQMWTTEELRLVEAIDNIVRSNKVFSEKNRSLPSKELIQLTKTKTWIKTTTNNRRKT